VEINLNENTPTLRTMSTIFNIDDNTQFPPLGSQPTGDIKAGTSATPRGGSPTTPRLKNGSPTTPRKNARKRPRIPWCRFDLGKDQGCGNRSCTFRHAQGLCKYKDCKYPNGCYFLHPEEVEVIAEGNRKFYRLRRRDKVVIEQYGNFGRELVKAAKADVATSQLVGGMTLNQRFTQQLAEKYGDAPKGSSIEVQTDGEPLRRFKDASTSNDNPYNTNRARFYREYNNPRRTKPARANSLTPGDIKLENKFAVLVDSPLLDEDERLDRRDRALAREERHAD